MLSLTKGLYSLTTDCSCAVGSPTCLGCITCSSTNTNTEEVVTADVSLCCLTGFSKLYIALEGETNGSLCRQACIPSPCETSFVTKPDAWGKVLRLHKVSSHHGNPNTTAASFLGESIRTDGMACSVVFKIMFRKVASSPAKKRKKGDDEPCPSAISDIQTHHPSLRDRVVGVDPGKQPDIWLEMSDKQAAVKRKC